jgi:hypothetical protein
VEARGIGCPQGEFVKQGEGMVGAVGDEEDRDVEFGMQGG